jgi:hypothetical protein
MTAGESPTGLLYGSVRAAAALPLAVLVMGAAALPLAVLVMGAAAAVPAVPDLPLAVLVIRAATALPLALPVPWGFAGMLVMRLLLMAGLRALPLAHSLEKLPALHTSVFAEAGGAAAR